MRVRKPMAAIAVASVFALAACGGDDGGGTKASGDEQDRAANTATSIALDPSRVDGPVEIEGATPGGTVRVVSSNGLNSMDPTEVYYQNTISIMAGLVTRSLTQYVYDEETGSQILIPDLATDLGTPNEDYTTWTFTVKEGITYEDGTPVEPEDFVYAAKRSMDRTQFPEGPAYSNQYFRGGDTYQGPYTDPDGAFDAVTVEGNTLTYHMAVPFPDLPYWLSFPTMGPIPEEAAADPAQYRLRPLATGPYKFDAYTPEKSLRLVRNPEWDPDTDPARTAYPDSYEMEFQVPADQINQLLLSDSGDAQTTLSYDDVLAANFGEFRDTGRLEIGGYPLTAYWAMDTRKITDLRVRQALALAYPYEDTYLVGGLIQGVTANPGSTLMPPGTAGRKEFEAIPGYAPGTTDVDAARALLEEADAVGFTISFPYAKDDPQSVATKDAIAVSLEEAGFKADPVPTTIADFSTLRADPDAPINVRPAGWIADWPAGGSWFPPLLKSTDLKREGLGSNYSAYAEKNVDAEIARIQALPVDEQPAAWAELDEIVMTESLPLFVTRYGGVAQPRGSRVEGAFIDNTIGMPTWKNIWVSE